MTDQTSSSPLSSTSVRYLSHKNINVMIIILHYPCKKYIYCFNHYQFKGMDNSNCENTTTCARSTSITTNIDISLVQENVLIVVIIIITVLLKTVKKIVSNSSKQLVVVDKVETKMVLSIHHSMKNNHNSMKKSSSDKNKNNQ